jgi:hypothetical protein
VHESQPSKDRRQQAARLRLRRGQAARQKAGCCSPGKWPIREGIITAADHRAARLRGQPRATGRQAGTAVTSITRTGQTRGPQIIVDLAGLEFIDSEAARHPLASSSLVIVPVGAISKLIEHALQAALSLGDEVIAVSVHPEAGQGAAFRADWDRWNPGVRLDTLDSPHRSLVHPIVGYVRRAQQPGRQVAVLITEVQPRRWRYRILQNQRGLLLVTVLRASTDAVICTIPYRLTSR